MTEADQHAGRAAVGDSDHRARVSSSPAAASAGAGAGESGFHTGVEVGHIEAGLRTGDIRRPFPEEANRRIIDTVATWHFATTARAREVLLAEGHSRSGWC